MTRDRSRGRAGSARDADSFFGTAEDRKVERKERQLCRQVQEAVSEALAGLEDDVLLEVWVADVEPAPDAGRLAVLVQAPRGTSPEEVAARLEKVAGYLRAEVASAITRKRVPTLIFRVLPPETGGES
ncbi:ribosome-binding factor A [Polyangium jinanense]|uniref:Ribosome-binding factor A n=1 Tax=Polyangium jinanense TaxID=2829994 RepID=A0A9X3X9Q0_9BACT|nr:ribosome-binding factor A [Polyangium jinanense]MDC3959858.1 ribosome-binding factor A [Polyangium jinanense]MDC3986309.1 ribosome-binding factor A [Polyangium jinanense]